MLLKAPAHKQLTVVCRHAAGKAGAAAGEHAARLLRLQHSLCRRLQLPDHRADAAGVAQALLLAALPAGGGPGLPLRRLPLALALLLLLHERPILRKLLLLPWRLRPLLLLCMLLLLRMLLVTPTIPHLCLVVSCRRRCARSRRRPPRGRPPALPARGCSRRRCCCRRVWWAHQPAHQLLHLVILHIFILKPAQGTGGGGGGGGGGRRCQRGRMVGRARVVKRHTGEQAAPRVTRAQPPSLLGGGQQTRRARTRRSAATTSTLRLLTGQ